jgi:hypothetical protein
LKPIIIPLPEDELSYILQDLEISYNTKRICYFKISYHKNPTKIVLRKLFKTIEQAIIEREITNYKATRLRETLVIKKQKKQRSKKLNLIGKLLEGKL